MTTRRIASQIATFAALTVAAFGGSVAQSASATVSGAGPNVVVVVLGGRVFTISLSAPVMGFTGVSQMGGGG